MTKLQAHRGGKVLRRSAFSIVELLVVIAIISVLLALLLPAIQFVRESARRTTCRNHLRQLGVAFASYESVHGAFPSGSSHKLQLLPFIDRVTEYEVGTQLGPFDTGSAAFQQYTAFDLPLYSCPSDPAARVMTGPGGALVGSTDYAGCSGIWFRNRNDFDGILGHANVSGSVRPSDVTDGMSNTILMSEIVHGDLSVAQNSELPHLRTVWRLSNIYGGYSQLDSFSFECSTIPSNAGSLGWTGNAGFRGLSWHSGNIGRGLYNHVLGPNRPSCLNGGDDDLGGAYTATSFHVGGVHSLFADGHLTFESNGIDLTLWRRMASRADGH